MHGVALVVGATFLVVAADTLGKCLAMFYAIALIPAARTLVNLGLFLPVLSLL